MAGKALQTFKRAVKDCYPSAVDKTNANYEELCMLMPKELGDHTYTGNKARQYILHKLNYMNFCRADDGRREKPTDVHTLSHAGTSRTWLSPTAFVWGS